MEQKIFTDLNEGEKRSQFVMVDSYDLENKSLNECRAYGFSWIDENGNYISWKWPGVTFTHYPFGRYLKKYMQEIIKLNPPINHNKQRSMKKTREEKLELLDKNTSKQLIKLSRKYPHFCAEYLVEMHRIIDLAEYELKKIISHA